MQKRTNMPSKAWVSLLWAQYNKLSEPLKESFINLAQSMAKETENQKPVSDCYDINCWERLVL